MAENSVIERAILETLHENGIIEDTNQLATSLDKEHNDVVGSMKSLQSSEMILVEARQLLLSALLLNVKGIRISIILSIC